MYDIVIIGAGITGAFIAHYLSKYDINVIVLEKNNEVSSGVTKGNSAIIHSGSDPLPNTLKAKLNILGNKMYDELCEELNVRIKKVGSLTVATNEEEVNTLKELVNRSKLNGVEVELLTKDELLKKEPNLNDDVILGLYAPSTKIISPWEMVYALLENAVSNGVELKTNCEVIDITKEKDIFNVKTKDFTIKSKYVINAAGLFADKVYDLVCQNKEFEIIPKSGQYYVLDKTMNNYVNCVIYPTPSKKGKGVLVVPTVDGNILLGPTSSDSIDREDFSTTKEEYQYIKNNVNKMMKNVPYKNVIHSFVGIRPKTAVNDFIIEESREVSNFINVSGIDSPGLASGPAIGEMVLSIVLNKEKYQEKKDYKVYKQKLLDFSKLDIKGKNQFIEKNKDYGKVVCRCEKITEGEIIAAIHSKIGAKTVDGIKRRCRPGMGRCQGSYCQPLILDILSKEIGIKKEEILLEDDKSNILIQETNKGVNCDE